MRRIEPPSASDRKKLAAILVKTRKYGRSVVACKYQRGLKVSEKIFSIKIREKVRDLIKKFGAPVRVLDIGCGSGVFARELKSYFGDAVDVHALDVIPMSEWKTAREDGVVFHIGHAENLSRFKKPFHLIVSNFGLCYSHNQLRAVDEAIRVLAKKGLLITKINEHLLTRTQNVDIGALAEMLRIKKPAPAPSVYDLFYEKGRKGRKFLRPDSKTTSIITPVI